MFRSRTLSPAPLLAWVSLTLLAIAAGTACGSGTFAQTATPAGDMPSAWISSASQTRGELASLLAAGAVLLFLVFMLALVFVYFFRLAHPWTHRNALGRVSVTVRVSYRSDPEDVRALLQKVASECPGLLQTPAPDVGFDEFGESALQFSLNAAIPDVNTAGGIQSDLRFRILKAFREAGIEMPFAQHDVHLRDLDGVRSLLMRMAEERARKDGVGAPDPKPVPET